MLARFSKAVVVLALAGSIGLHWAFFQSVAWVNMVISYAQGEPLTEALQKTFDGKHPCALCKQLAKTKQSEKKSDLKPMGKGFEFSFAFSKFVFCAPSHYWSVSGGRWLPRAFISSPPVPPPRAIA